MGFPGSLDGKESACNAGDLGLIPWLGRSPEGGHGNPLQYFAEGMAIHSSILARRIPWTEELVGYSLQGLTELNTPEAT